jgi:trans-aconitate 2-methyltransferase
MAARASAGSREWDAGTYHRISEPQRAWGRAVLERLDLAGTETVIDAGCGSGSVTELILDAVPGGRVIAVDGSSEMAEHAREHLGARAEVIQSDLLALELDEVAGAVFSSATFHWILDHRRLFERIFSWLRPGGQLEAQCGGAGNLAGFFTIVERLGRREPFAALAQLPASWRFATAEETAQLLAEVGFADVRCWLEPNEVRPSEPRAYIETVCLGAHLEALAEDQRAHFVDEVHEAWGPDRVLGYLRLNISARRPPAG